MLIKERNNTIDLLRLMASSWVVFFHLNEPIAQVNNVYGDIYKMGALGVPIFFVVSGYCIALAAEHSKNSIDFFVRRFFRIFPMYWFSLVVVAGCVFFYVMFFGQNSVALLPKSFHEISATLTLLTSPFSSVHTVNWVYWSLTVEIFFYMVIGFSLLFRQPVQNAVLLMLSLLVFVPNLHQVYGLFFLTYWPAFGIGYGLYALKSGTGTRYFPWLQLVINFSALFFIHGNSAYSIASLSAFVLIAVSVFWKDLDRNFFSGLGDYAYSVYLIHVPLGVYILNYYKTPAVQSNMLYHLSYDLLVLVILLVFAGFTFNFIELPTNKFGKKVAEKINKRFYPLITVHA